MKHHHYKVWPQYESDMRSGLKSFDVRRVDPAREAVEAGDLVTFEVHQEDGTSLQRSFCKRVTYVLRGTGRILPFEFFVMSLVQPCQDGRCLLGEGHEQEHTDGKLRWRNTVLEDLKKRQ